MSGYGSAIQTTKLLDEAARRIKDIAKADDLGDSFTEHQITIWLRLWVELWEKEYAQYTSMKDADDAAKRQLALDDSNSDVFENVDAEPTPSTGATRFLKLVSDACDTAFGFMGIGLDRLGQAFAKPGARTSADLEGYDDHVKTNPPHPSVILEDSVLAFRDLFAERATMQTDPFASLGTFPAFYCSDSTLPLDSWRGRTDLKCTDPRILIVALTLDIFYPEPLVSLSTEMLNRRPLMAHVDEVRYNLDETPATSSLSPGDEFSEHRFIRSFSTRFVKECWVKTARQHLRQAYTYELSHYAHTHRIDELTWFYDQSLNAILCPKEVFWVLRLGLYQLYLYHLDLVPKSEACKIACREAIKKLITRHAGEWFAGSGSDVDWRVWPSERPLALPVLSNEDEDCDDNDLDDDDTEEGGVVNKVSIQKIPENTFVAAIRRKIEDRGSPLVGLEATVATHALDFYKHAWDAHYRRRGFESTVSSPETPVTPDAEGNSTTRGQLNLSNYIAIRLTSLDGDRHINPGTGPGPRSNGDFQPNHFHTAKPDCTYLAQRFPSFVAIWIKYFSMPFLAMKDGAPLRQQTKLPLQALDVGETRHRGLLLGHCPLTPQQQHTPCSFVCIDAVQLQSNMAYVNSAVH